MHSQPAPAPCQWQKSKKHKIIHRRDRFTLKVDQSSAIVCGVHKFVVGGKLKKSSRALPTLPHSQVLQSSSCSTRRRRQKMNDSNVFVGTAPKAAIFPDHARRWCTHVTALKCRVSCWSPIQPHRVMLMAQQNVRAADFCLHKCKACAEWSAERYLLCNLLRSWH